MEPRTEEQVSEDLKQLETPLLVQFASALSGLGALFALGTFLQGMLVFRLALSVTWGLLGGCLVAAVLTVVTLPRYYRLRKTGFVIAVIAVGSQVVLSFSWLVYAVLSGFFTLSPLAAGSVSLLGLTTVLISTPWVLRASAARKRLAGEGLDL